MSADSEQEPTGRRRKTRSDKGRPRKAKLNMPAPPKAIAEIDQRLAAAIAERTHAVQQVADEPSLDARRCYQEQEHLEPGAL